MKDVNIYELINNLIGNIDPIGESNEDEKRFDNLKEYTELIDKLMVNVRDVARSHEHHAFSIQRSGKHARAFLDNTHNCTHPEEL